MNFRQPNTEDVDHSVDRVILAAKARAIMDGSGHRRDMVALDYLDSACRRLKQALGPVLFRPVNVRQPRVERSINRVIYAATERARLDHKDSFASDRERDMVASVYLERARDKLKEELE